MYSLNTTGLMVSQGLGFAAAGALAGVTGADIAIGTAGVAGVVAVAATSALRARSGRSDIPVDSATLAQQASQA